MDPTNNREKKMALTYKQVIYIFNRSIEWMDLPDAERTERIKDEMLRIDWNRVPNDPGQINYEEYYRKD